MNALVCGLNTYLGRAILTYLQNDNLRVHGLIRDYSLLQSKINNPINATLYNMDIARAPHSVFPIPLPPIDVAFYFTQIPDLADEVGMHFELLSLKNFIHLSLQKNCKRIIYFGRIYDKTNIGLNQELFERNHIDYSIVLKDVAIGNGSSFDQFMQQMMSNRLIFLYKPTQKLTFKPIALLDFIQWIGRVDWKNTFINEYIEFGGTEVYEIEDLMHLYMNKYSNPEEHRIITIPYKAVAKTLNKLVSKVPYDTYASYIQKMSKRALTDNSKWSKNIPFQYAKIDSVL